MKLIIDISKNNYNQIREGFYEDNCGVMAISIIDGTPISDNATNGEVIKAIFPNIQISDSEVMKNVYTGIPYGELIGANIDCMREWWNASYQKGGSDRRINNE